jgi:hypothetical protein
MRNTHFINSIFAPPAALSAPNFALWFGFWAFSEGIGLEIAE